MTRSGSVKALIPREHGAWVQLGFPVLCALMLGEVTAVSVALVGAALAAFMVHEPLLVLLGQRGTRAARERHTDAVVGVAALASAALTLLVVALVFGTDKVRFALLAPVTSGCLILLFVLTNREKTALGEGIAVVALTSWALPVALAAGAPLQLALLAWATWVVAFELATTAIRAVIHRRADPEPHTALAAISVACVLTALVGAAAGFLPFVVGLALLPVASLVAWMAFEKPHPKQLKQLGWWLAAASTGTLLALGIGLG